MEWLSQNWVWLAFTVGMLFMMRRGGAGGCCGGHVADDKHPETGKSRNEATTAGQPPGTGSAGEPS